MKVLLTGFNPFGGLEVNPSQEIVEAIGRRGHSQIGIELATEVLPTEFNAAEKRVRKLIRDLKPEAIVCLGVSESLGAISLERIAVNIDDSPEDNAGESRRGEEIVPNGPPAFWSTLPLAQILTALQNNNIPAGFSNHAGTYVCNHVFYSALHEVQQLDLRAKCGLIHVPLMVDQLENPESTDRGLPLETMILAIECCLEVLRNEAATS